MSGRQNDVAQTTARSVPQVAFHIKIELLESLPCRGGVALVHEVPRRIERANDRIRFSGEHRIPRSRSIGPHAPPIQQRNLIAT